MDVVFLGLSKGQWEIINGFANWLAAIGTISAVAVSLYLARSGSRPRAKLSANSIVMVDLDLERQAEQGNYVQLRVVNVGDREFNVVSIGWRMGRRRKKKLFMQMFSREISSALPIKLAHGESADWRFPIAGGDDWYTRISSNFEVDWISELRSIRFVVSTSIGDEFQCSLDENIIARLRDKLTSLHGPSSFFISLKNKIKRYF
ncbi:hypothetical protein [Pseudomonas putida]|uniref:hypothetical protein n=1 Tax=Pseudomonas putida TaxID=303 RepID=UPI003D97D255